MRGHTVSLLLWPRLPWTYIPGNHDDDGAPWDRADLLQIYDLPGCASQGAKQFNHTFTIGPGHLADASTSLRLWLFVLWHD